MNVFCSKNGDSSTIEMDNMNILENFYDIVAH